MGYIYRHYTGYVGERYEEPIFDESGDYSSFDKVCDALDKKLAELHKSIGKAWSPYYTREYAKKYVEDNISMIYAYFDECKYYIYRVDIKE